MVEMRPYQNESGDKLLDEMKALACAVSHTTPDRMYEFSGDQECVCGDITSVHISVVSIKKNSEN